MESDGERAYPEFEYDPAKSAANLVKHGIDFEMAKELWRDDDSITIALDYPEEPRLLVVCRISGKHWSAIITHRDDDQVRIISVRPSRQHEVAAYEQEKNHR